MANLPQSIGQVGVQLADLLSRDAREKDATKKIIAQTNLLNRKAEVQYHRDEKLANLRGNLVLLNSAEQEQDILQEEKELKEEALKAIGVVFDDYSNLSSDDVTEDGQSLFEFSYNKTQNELNMNEVLSLDVAGKTKSLVEQNNILRQQISQLDNRNRDINNLNADLRDMSRYLHNQESKQPIASADWQIDDIEYSNFIAANPDDYRKSIEQYGGNEKKLRRDLEKHFIQFTKDQRDVLSKVHSEINERANAIKAQREIAMLDSASGPMAKGMRKQIKDYTDEVLGTVGAMGDNFSFEQRTNNPILNSLTFDKMPIGSGRSGWNQYMSNLEHQMVNFIKTIDDGEIAGLEDIPSELRNDSRTLALFYSGRITPIDDLEFVKKNPDFDKMSGDNIYISNEGKSYFIVDKEKDQNEFFIQRTKGFDLNPTAISIGSKVGKEVVISSIKKFLDRYSISQGYNDKINEMEHSFQNNFGISPNPVTNPYNPNHGKLEDSLLSEEEKENSKKLIEFQKKYHWTTDAIAFKAAEENKDIYTFIDDFNDLQSRNVFGFTKDEARNFMKNVNEDGITGEERAYEIVEMLKDIEKQKDKELSLWLKAGGDALAARDRQNLFFNEDFHGDQWEILHQEGAMGINELRQIRDIAEIGGLDYSIYNYYLESDGKSTGMKGIGKRYGERPYQYKKAYKDWLPISDDNMPDYYKDAALQALDEITVTP